jgi:hypothetical protein
VLVNCNQVTGKARVVRAGQSLLVQAITISSCHAPRAMTRVVERAFEYDILALAKSTRGPLARQFQTERHKREVARVPLNQHMLGYFDNTKKANLLEISVFNLSLKKCLANLQSMLASAKPQQKIDSITFRIFFLVSPPAFCIFLFVKKNQ